MNDNSCRTTNEELPGLLTHSGRSDENIPREEAVFTACAETIIFWIAPHVM